MARLASIPTARLIRPFPALLCFETTPCLFAQGLSGVWNAFRDERLLGNELALPLVLFKILRTFSRVRVGDGAASQKKQEEK